MHDVDGRLVHERGRWPGDDFVPIGHFLRPGDGAPDGVMGAAEQGAVGGAREQETAREQRGQAEQQRAGAAEQLRQPSAEQPADKPAVIRAERHHQAGEGHGDAGAEGLHVEQGAAE